MFTSEAHYLILKFIKDNPKVTQRQLAQEFGLSLGRTNYVVRSLINKGWVKLSNFKRSDNKLGYLYLITPKGVAGNSKLAQNFLKSKSREYTRLKKEIEILKKEL